MQHSDVYFEGNTHFGNNFAYYGGGENHNDIPGIRVKFESEIYVRVGETSQRLLWEK